MTRRLTSSHVLMLGLLVEGAVLAGPTPALAGIPAAPTGLTASASSPTSAILDWTDNSTNENGFSIERRSGGSSFSQIGWVPDSVTTFTNSGLTAGTSYTYRVLAFNGSGNSAPTNDVTVMTAGSARVVSLINAGWHGNTIPTPSFIRDNLTFLESRPFDGLVIYLRKPDLTADVTQAVMTNIPLSEETARSVLAPLQGLNLVNLTHNLALVQATAPPDFFDDWAVTIQNFATLARTIREVGLTGICLDNEQYFVGWGDFTNGMADPSKTLQEYQDQARLRGKQVMEAIVTEFPDIVFLTLHGPSISEEKAPIPLGFPDWQDANELLGPFFAGGVEGAGATAAPMDGGELYTLRTAQDFSDVYNWSKYELPSAAVDCPFIPASLRPVWPGAVLISFGVYDLPFHDVPMDPTILRSTLANALQQADRYVWFYPELYTYLSPPGQNDGAPAEWVDAIQQARMPAEVLGLSFPIDAGTLTWSSLANVTGYDLLRSTDPSTFAESVCTVPDSATSAVDTEPPGHGDLFFYIARGRNTHGVGTLGTDSDGIERIGQDCP